MRLKELRDVWQSEPFRPLTLHMVDGKTVVVPHPDHLFFVPDTEMVFVVGDEAGKRTFRFLTPDQIASVEISSVEQ